MLDIKCLFVCVSMLIGGAFNSLLVDGSNNDGLLAHVRPDAYTLHIVINEERAIFTGNVSIALRVLNATDSVRLHARDISVNWWSAELEDVQNDALAVSDVSSLKNDVIALKFNDTLAIGVYQLRLSFFNQIREKLEGLYMIANGQKGPGKRVTIATNDKMRRVFPCFDHPEFRAKFQLNLYHDRSFTVISNMPIAQRTGPHADYNGLMLSEFPETIEMPTYSFGFTAGQYALYTVEKQRVNLYTEINKNVTETTWYYQQATEILDKLELFIGKAFHLPKLHIVASSYEEEFGLNMWGVIRVPEKYIFYDEKRARDAIIDDHQDGITYLANQIARSWFLNAITPASGWLSDGFAKYLEYLITAPIMPDWRLLEQFLVRENHIGLAGDASLTTPSLAEVSNDAKAGAVIRMIEGALGSDLLKRVIRQYVATKSGSIATADDLIAIIQAEVTSAAITLPTNVKAIIDSWINVPGHSVIKISRQYGDSAIVTITQKRALNDVDKTGDEVYPQQYIPITLSTRDSLDFNETVPSLWLSPITTTALNSSYTLKPPVAPSSWIIVNNQESGFYRVNYDRINWNLLMLELKQPDFGNIPVLNRAQLVDDAIYLSECSERSFHLGFDVLRYLQDETDFVVWKTATRVLNMMERMEGGSEKHHLLELFIRNITSNVYGLIPVTRNETNHVLRMQRRDVAMLACKAGLPACVDEVNDIFHQVLRNPSLIMPEMQETIFCTAIKFSSNPGQLAQTIIEYALKTYKGQRAANREEIYRVVAGLGCLRDERILLKYLDLTTTFLPSSIKVDLTKKDRQIIFTSILKASYIGTKSCIEHMKRTFSAMELRFESMPRLLQDFGPYIVSQELLTRFTDTLETHNTKLTDAMAEAAKHSTKIANRNLKWREINDASIADWLTENVIAEKVTSNASLHMIHALTVFTVITMLYSIQRFVS